MAMEFNKCKRILDIGYYRDINIIDGGAFTTQRLNVTWTREMAEDLKNFEWMDIADKEQELMNELTRLPISPQIIDRIRQLAVNQQRYLLEN